MLVRHVLYQLSYAPVLPAARQTAKVIITRTAGNLSTQILLVFFIYSPREHSRLAGFAWRSSSREFIDPVAELAGEFRAALLLDHVLQLLPAHADEGPAPPAPGCSSSGTPPARSPAPPARSRTAPAAAAPARRCPDPAAAVTAPSLCDSLLNGGDDGIVRPWQELDEVAARRLDATGPASISTPSAQAVGICSLSTK